MKKRRRRAQKIIGADDSAAAMDAALRLLATRQRTVGEMKKRLVRKGFAGDLAGAICEKLKGMGYLDDRQFALSWVKSRSGPKFRSAWLLKKELRDRGVEASLAEEVVSENTDETAVFSDACKLVRKRLEKESRAGGKKFAARMQNLLLRRGFNYELIRNVLKEAIGGAEGEMGE